MLVSTLLLGCGTASLEAAAPHAEAPTQRSAPPAATGELSPAKQPPLIAEDSTPEPVDEPIGVRTSARMTSVHASPDAESEVLGSIPSRRAFYVYEFVDGGACRGEGWARVHRDAYACVRQVLGDDGEPVALPVLREGETVPFLYAKPRAKPEDGAPAVPRWRSRRAYSNDKDPIESLVEHGSYAFVKRRGSKRGPVYVDKRKRAVPVEKMRRFKPSGFRGRNLLERPLPQGETVAWTRMRETEILETASKKGERVSRPRYHAELQVKAEPVHAEGRDWYEVVDTGHGISGFIRAREVRTFTPPASETSIRDDETWIDVDVGQQMLTIMRGSTPTFVTLVSTGRSGDGTPAGLFRIYAKKALDQMESQEGSDDPYYVEAVPWAQYFHRDFALHAAYWHDMFGNRASHGCVNLSPRDGARLFELTSPNNPPGWNTVRERWREPGTLVRVRKPGKAVPDRRAPLSPPSAAAAPPLVTNE